MQRVQSDCDQCGVRRACDPSSQPVVDIDTDGRIVTYNAAAERLLGQLSRGEVGSAALARGPCASWQLTIIEPGDGAPLLRLTPLPAAELLAAATTGIVARGITHDLNNLFTCILATATMPTRLDQDPARHLSVIRQAVLRGSELLSLLRDLTQDEGEVEADVYEAIEGCGLLLERVGARVGVELTVTPLSSRVAMAPRELQQIIINLGLNAIDAMTAGGGRLELGARAGDGWVELVVADTGPGIPPERFESLFRPGATTKPGHSGIGLAVVRALVQHAGGAVHVDSTVGHGTRFAVRLPVIGAAS